MIPRGTAATKAIRIASKASSMVTGNRSFRSSMMGFLYQRDVPMSPFIRSQTQAPYWICMGRFSPIFSRSLSMSAVVTFPVPSSSPVRSIMAASPGTIQNKANTMIVAKNSVGMKRRSLLLAYCHIISPGNHFEPNQAGRLCS